MTTAPFPRSKTAVLLAAGALSAVGLVVVPLIRPGPLSDQMIQHLATMNVIAPLAAACLPVSPMFARGATLALASLAQILLLWMWHAPAAQTAIAASPVFHALALLGLAAASVAFWRCAIEASAVAPWRAIAALLVTGKLACLLGALMVFAPRDLYEMGGLALALCSSGPSSLQDQQLAGLLMISACPISYLVAGVALAAQMIAQAGRERAADAAV